MATREFGNAHPHFYTSTVKFSNFDILTINMSVRVCQTLCFPSVNEAGAVDSRPEDASLSILTLAQRVLVAYNVNML